MFRPHDSRERAIPWFESRHTRRRHARRQRSGSCVAEFERLENRTLLSTVSDNGTSTVTITLAAAETLSLSTSGNTITFTSNTDFSNGGVAHSSDFSGFTSTTLTFKASDTTNYSAIDIVDGGTQSGTSVTFNNSTGSYLDAVAVDLSNSAAGAITFLGTSSFGSNSLSATTTANIVVGNGSTATTVETASGGITFSANQQATPNAGNFAGIEVDDATVESTGTGLISFAGRGGTSGTGDSDQFGVYVTNGGVVEAGTTGTSTIDGTGGAASGNYNTGVYVDTPSTALSEITSNGGNISVTGQGGGTGSSQHDYGVRIASGLVTAVSAGSVSVTGTGASAAGSVAIGVEIEKDPASTLDGVVTSSGGPVAVTGVGGGTGGSNWGVIVQASAKVTATGAGTVSVLGTGGGDATGTDNSGVAVLGTITSSGGAVSVTGTPGPGTSQYGIEVESGGAISTASNAALGLTTDSLSIDTSATPGRVSAGTGTVTIKEKTATTAINFVSSSGTGLWLTPAEVGEITAGTLQFGDTNAGSITINASLSRAAATILMLTTGSNISFGSSGVLNSDGAAVTLAAPSGSINGNASTTDVTGTTLTLTASTGIGSTTALTTAVSTLSFTNSTSGQVTITNTGNLSVSGSNTGGGALSLTEAGAGNTLTVNSSNLTNTGGGAINLAAALMTLTGTVSGTGALTLQPNTNSRGIEIGGNSISGTLDLPSALLAQLGTTFSGITIGTASQTGTITVDAATSFSKPLALEEESGGHGIITIASPLTGGGSVTLLGSGDTTNLDANIVTSGQPIAIDDDVVVGANATLDTTDNNGSPAGASITINTPGTIDDATSGAHSLTLDAGTAGSVTIVGTVGGNTALGSLSITGQGISLASIGSPSAAGVTGTTTVSANSTGGSISLTGTNYATSGSQSYNAGSATNAITLSGGSTSITTADAPVSFTGALSLNSNALAIDTVNSSGGTITFNNTVSGTGALGLTAGTANVNFDAAVGGTTPLTRITVNSAQNVDFAGTVRTTGNLAQSAGSGTTTFNGTNGSGIGGDVSITTGSVAFDSSTFNVQSYASLDTTGTVTQVSSGAIVADGLDLLGSGAVVLNTSASNQVGTLVADLTGSGSLTYADSAALIVGTVDATQGITTKGNVTLTAGGLLTIGSGAGEGISASGATVTLDAAGVTETTTPAPSLISATGLLLTGTGTFAVAQASPSADNSVGTLAAMLVGNLSFTDSSALSIGTVGTTSGITSGNGSTNGNVTIASTGANTALTVNAGILSLGGNVTLYATGNLTVSSNQTLNSDSGSMTLNADVTSLGAGDDGTGTLTIGAGAAVYGTSIKLRGADENIASTATVGSATGGGTAAYSTAQVTIQSSIESRPMLIGGSNSNPVAGINLTTAELGCIFTASTGTVTIGDTNQTGNITFDTAMPATTAGTTTTVVQSTSGPGQIILDNHTGGTATALNGNGGNVTLTAGTGGIVEASGNVVGTADIANAGTASFTSAGPIGASGAPVQIGASNLGTNTSANNSNEYLSATGTVTIDPSGLNAGSGTVELDGGTFDLGASNEISAGSSLNINGSTLAMGGYSDTVSTLTLSSGSITGSGVLTSSNTIQTESGSVSAVLAGSHGLTQSTAGTTTLSGANTFSGTTTVSAGNLTFVNQTIPTTQIAIATGATLEIDYTVTSGFVRQPTTTLTGDGTLLKMGAGEFVFGGAGTINWDLSPGALIDVEQGTLIGGSVVQDVWTSNESDLNIASGATFEGTEANVNIDKLTGAGTLMTGYALDGYVAFNVGVNNGSSTFAGAITDSPPSPNSGHGSLNKVGTGTLTLTGANTYTGTTTVSAGTLLIDGSTTSSSAVTVDSGATLGGSGTAGGAVTVNSGGELAPGDTPGILNTASVSLASGSTFSAEIDGATVGSQYSQDNVAGSISLNGATLNIVCSLPAYALTPGTVLDLITASGGVSGTFNGLPEGATVMVGATPTTISYAGGHNVTLTVSGAVVVPGADAGPYVLKLVGLNDVLTDNGSVISSLPLAALTSYTLNAGAYNTQLTVDFSGGNPIPAGGLTFAGNTSYHNTLDITGESGVAETYNFTNAHDGSVVVGSSTINYSGLSPIVDNGSATARTFSYNSTSTGTIQVDAAAAGSNTITAVGLGETVTFTDPTQSLAIDANNAANTVIINTIDPGFNAALTISATTAGSVATINTPLSLGSTTGPSTGAIAITAPTIDLNANLSSNANAIATAGNIDLAGAVTLGASVALDTHATTSGTITLGGPVTGSTYNLSLNSGTNGTITATGAVSGVGTLTLINSGGASFQSTLGATTVAIQNTTGTVQFVGAATIGTLTTQAQPYNVAFDAGGTVSSATSFLNTGSVTLGNSAASAITFSGALNTSAGPSNTNLAGNITATNSPITLGTVTLTAATTANAGSAALTFSGTVDGAFTLAADSSAATTFAQAVGGTTPLAGLTTNAGGTTAIDTTVVNTANGNQTYNDNVTLGASTTLSASGTGGITFAAAVDDTTAATHTLTLDAGSGGVSLLGVGQTTPLDGLAIATAGLTTLGGNIATENLSGSAGTVDLSAATGGIRLATSVTISTDGGAVNASGSALSADATNLNLSVDTSTSTAGMTGGAVTLAALNNAGGQDVNQLTINTSGPTYGAVTLTGNAALASTVSITGNGVGTQAVSSASGTITINAQNALSVGGNITATDHAISLLANQDGAGTEAFTQTNNTTIAGTAVTITVNTAGGTGTGGAVVSNITDGGATLIDTGNSGGTDGGNITRTAASTLSAATSITLTTGTGSVGTGTGASAMNLASGQTNVIVTTHSASGNVYLVDAGNLGLGAITATGGNVTVNATGTLNVAGAVSMTGGALSLTAGGTLTVNAAIDPANSVVLTSNANVVVNSAVTAVSSIQALAGQASPFAGSVTLNAGGTLTTTGAGSAIALTAGTAGTSNISLSASVTAGDAVTAGNSVAMTASAGSITGAALVTGTTLNLSAASGINNGASGLATAATNVSAINSGNAAVWLANSLASGTAVINALESKGGSVELDQTGGATLQLSGTGNVLSGGSPASTNGGNITVNSTNGLTLATGSTVSSANGTGGVLTIHGVTVDGTVTVGAGNITLNGGNTTAQDTVINAPLSSTTTMVIDATRDVIINSTVTTTGASSNINLTADTNGTGTGGVWITSTGQVHAGGGTTIKGSDVYATSPALDSVRVDANGTNAQILTGPTGAIVIQNNAAAPAGADIYLNGVVQSAGTGTIDVTAQHNIQLSNNVLSSAGAITFHEPVALTGSATVNSANTAPAGATITFDSTIDGASALTLSAGTAGSVSLTNPVGGATALSALTASGNGFHAASTVATSGNIALTFRGDVVLGNTVNAGSGTIAIAANQAGSGTQGLVQTGTITTTNSTASAVSITVNTAAGNHPSFSVNAIDDTSAGSVVAIKVNGAAIQNGLASGDNVTASSLALTAATGIGTSAKPLATAVTNLAASNNGSGDIQVANDNGANLTIASVTSAQGTLAGVTNADALHRAGQIVITSTAPASGAGPITVSQPVSDTAGGNITLNAQNAGALTVSANVGTTNGNGNVQLLAGAITQNGSSVVSTAGTGSILYDNHTASGADITMSPNTQALTNHGTITLDANRNVALGNLTTTDQNISVTAGSGAITNANATGTMNGGPSNVDINTVTSTVVYAPLMILNAATGIGTSALPLATAVPNVTAQTTSGGIFLNNTGSLNIVGAGLTTGVTAGSGDVTINLGGTNPVLNVPNTAAVNTGAGQVTLSLANETAAQRGTIAIYGDVDQNSGPALINGGPGTGSILVYTTHDTSLTLDGKAGNDNYVIDLNSSFLGAPTGGFGVASSGPGNLITINDTGTDVANSATINGDPDGTTYHINDSAAANNEVVTSTNKTIAFTNNLQFVAVNGDSPPGPVSNTYQGDVFDVSPSKYTTFTLNANGPGFGPTTPNLPGDILNYVPRVANSTITSITCNTIETTTTPITGPPDYQDINYANFETFHVNDPNAPISAPYPANPGDFRQFDFNTYTSPNQTYYTSVLPSKSYTGGYTGTNFGWATTTGLVAVDRGTPNALLRDGQAVRDDTFSADIVQPGYYLVNVTLGDRTTALHSLSLVANGGQGNITEFSGVSTVPGQFLTENFVIQVTPGQMRLDLTLNGGSGDFEINSLEIQPATLLTMGLYSSNPAPVADGTSIDTIYGYDPSHPNSLITVSATAGTIVTPDASPYYGGIQVLSDATGHFSFQIQRPASAVQTMIMAEPVTEGTASPSSPGMPLAPLETGCLELQYLVPPLQRFDFNASSSVTEPGFTAVRGSMTHLDDPTVAGFGWSTPASEFDRAGPNDLERDGQYGTDDTFWVQVNPKTTYTVRLYLGDAAAVRDNISATVDGVLLNGNPSTGPVNVTGTLGTGIYGLDTALGQFITPTYTFTTGPNEYAAQVELNGDAGGATPDLNPYFSIVGLDLWVPGQVAAPAIPSLAPASVITSPAPSTAPTTTAPTPPAANPTSGSHTPTGANPAPSTSIGPVPVATGELAGAGTRTSQAITVPSSAQHGRLLGSGRRKGTGSVGIWGARFWNWRRPEVHDARTEPSTHRRSEIRGHEPTLGLSHPTWLWRP